MMETDSLKSESVFLFYEAIIRKRVLRRGQYKMQEIQAKTILKEMAELLSFVTQKSNEEYEKYMGLNQRKLFAYKLENKIVGCIGIELISGNLCEIKHIVVSPEERGQKIGSQMVQFVCKRFNLTSIFAETDQEAVGFYQKRGFDVESLGEKYPGRERFLCTLHIEKTSHL
ncbi:GNAT family N-acetyltransferase [Planococcus sp. YIM B11945]|uniref:GNAT family N-acetyltransferase n=1 Tax=Planococcus sp. YIM B11945 TaxID=3435410 RepID=UPI003D7EC0E5